MVSGSPEGAGGGSVDWVLEELSPEEFERQRQKERERTEAGLLVLYAHLEALGRYVDYVPHLLKGYFKCSIPGVFTIEEHAENPVNIAAINLLPKSNPNHYPGQPQADDKIFQTTVRLPDDLTAFRQGMEQEFIVARNLGLTGPVALATFTDIEKGGYLNEDARRLVKLREAVSDIPADLNAEAYIVRGAEEMAAMAKEYPDFPAYLIHVKGEIDARVAERFPLNSN